LPTTRHSCNLDVWALMQSRGDGHRSLVTPKRILSDHNKDLTFFRRTKVYNKLLTSKFCGALSRVVRIIMEKRNVKLNHCEVSELNLLSNLLVDFHSVQHGSYVTVYEEP